MEKLRSGGVGVGIASMRSKQSSDGSSKIGIIVDDMNDFEWYRCGAHTLIRNPSWAR